MRSRVGSESARRYRKVDDIAGAMLMVSHRSVICEVSRRERGYPRVWPRMNLGIIR